LLQVLCERRDDTARVHHTTTVLPASKDADFLVVAILFKRHRYFTGCFMLAGLIMLLLLLLSSLLALLLMMAVVVVVIVPSLLHSLCDFNVASSSFFLHRYD
jgi:membrane protein YdbS with pleckstrin-like domain